MNLNGDPIPGLERKLSAMLSLIRHRGPDDEDVWIAENKNVGFAHARLSIIDTSTSGRQPMVGENGAVVVHNGEVYNYIELRETLGEKWAFRSDSDTEAILATHAVYGASCLDQFRGMFAFSIWDGRQLFCARDRFGIKPFYYAVIDECFYFASEAKAILPFVHDVETDPAALSEYLTFQYLVGTKTLFKGISQLEAGHLLKVGDGGIRIERYWDIKYDVDMGLSAERAADQVRSLLDDSIRYHVRSDVPIGMYVSGGLDSSLVASKATAFCGDSRPGFHGRFQAPAGFDESEYAKIASTAGGIDLNIRDIDHHDFETNIFDIIKALDYPVAGPGSFCQYIVSGLAAENVKVVLGGQGGDEIFGGYARYVIAYFEQCIRAAIDGTYKSGNFVVTAESIIENLGSLREYKPMLQKFWSNGLFGPMDTRYFQLIERASDVADLVNWGDMDEGHPRRLFDNIFNSEANVRKEAYFDSMTHFDFKTLLPALLHVEDRVSMAHGLEARVPLLDHPLVEFLATVPADVKFEGGQMKLLMRQAFSDVLPEPLLKRRDKMGFPVPLNQWAGNELRDFIGDIFGSRRAQERPYLKQGALTEGKTYGAGFSRRLWALLSLEIWQQVFHDKAAYYRALV